MVTPLVVGAFILTGVTLWLRLLPSRGGRLHGVDAWFYLLYADALRRQRRLPARLRHFVLDIEEQWYPPLFPVVLALIPERWRLRWREWVSPAVDALHLVVLLCTASSLGFAAPAILLAATIYAVTPTLVYEHSTLNSRSLGNLVFTIAILSLMGLVRHAAWPWLALGALTGALVFLVHKMATQLFVMMTLGLGIVERRLDLLAVVVLSVVGALVLSGGFYVKILRGHLEILRFWRKHLARLNAHQVYDSPLYAGSRTHTRPERPLYQQGFAGTWRLARVLVAHNPWALLLPWVLWDPPLGEVNMFLLAWAEIGWVAVLLTTFVSPLRFLGEGVKYVKFTIFPTALLLGQALTRWPEVLLTVPFLLLSGVAIRRLLGGRELEHKDEDFRKTVAFLGGDSREPVATIPVHLADPVAYLTGKRVLWGGHSGGYGKLEAWYPVIACPIPDVLDRYHAPLLLIDQRYVRAEDLDLGSALRPVFEQGRFLLFERLRPSGART